MEKPSTVLVTGASGQLGRRLVRRLIADGYRVRAHYRNQDKAQKWCPPQAEPIFGDLIRPGWLHKAAAGCDYVIHGAAIVSLRPIAMSKPERGKLMYQVNVDGTKAIIASCRTAKVKRLIHVSTTGAVGGSVDGGVLDENAHFNLGGYGIPYFETKRQAEEIALNANREPLEVVVVNPSIMISPPDRKVTEADLKKIPKRLPAYFDFGVNVVETDDVVDGIIKAMKKGRPGERYILAGENIGPKRVFELTEKYLGLKKPLLKIPLWMVYILGLFAEAVYINKDKKPPLNSAIARLARLRFFYTSNKAERELGYKARPLEQTIENMLASIKGLGQARTTR